MDIKQAESDMEAGVRQRKFGLPDWMVNNIERLNFATDFEQYACSPPETEGFLSDYKEGQDISLSEPYCPVVEPKPFQGMNMKSDPITIQSKCQLSKLIINPPDHLHHSVNSLKNEELFSSPDVTPCATPEPSPVIRRKMSNPSDTVVTNPGRWFYIGKINKLPKKLKGKSSDLKLHEDKANFEGRSANISDSIIDSRKNGIKLMISNFDLNAVSPTSW